MRGFVTLTLFLGLAACGEEEEDPLCGREVALTYDTWGKGFLDTHCNGCHNL